MTVVEAGDEAVGCLADDGNIPTMSRGAGPAPEVLRPSGGTRILRSVSSASAHHGWCADHALRCLPRIEGAIVDFNAEGVGKLRAGSSLSCQWRV